MRESTMATHAFQPHLQQPSGDHEDTWPILPLYQEWLAHFTGQWPPGYRLRWRRTPWWHLVTMLISLAGSVTASIVIATGPWRFWPYLLLSWMLTVHSCRKAQLVICHYAVHANMTGHKWSDRLLVELLSTLLCIQHFKGYYRDHVQVHHGLALATLADADLQFLLVLGFRPGMSRQALWRCLYWTMVSPRFHMLFVWMRLRVNFLAAPLYRRAMSGGYIAVVMAGLYHTQGWLPFAVAWLIPLFPLYHVAALLQFVSEHRWLSLQQPAVPQTGKG